VREREGLIARIRQIRRAADSPDQPRAADSPDQPRAADSPHRRRAADSPDQPGSGQKVPGPEELSALEARITHLERLVQGLQDSVHRESSRHAKRIAELEARIQPGAISKALSKDARERGL
jgi:hypothetical protein